MADPQSLAKGLMADGPVMRAYEPSWRDRMAAALMGDGRASPARAQVVMGLMGSRGLGPTGLSAVDATPAGAVLDMQQAAQHGDKAGMAMAAAGFVPGAKVAEKVAAKVAEAAPAVTKEIIGYHGSPNSFEKFNINYSGSTTDGGHLGKAHYLSTDKNVPLSFPHKYEAKIKFNNPLNISLPDFKTDKRNIIRDALELHRTASPSDVTNAAISKGYDGVILDYSPTGYEHKEIAVFDDGIIEIMRKYGLAGSAGAAMAAEILQRQNGGQPQGQAVAPAM